MNRSSIVALVLGALLFGCGVGMVANEVMEPEVAIAWEGKNWEYEFIETKMSKEKTRIAIQEAEARGWEFAGFSASLGHVFKRPLN